MQMVLTKAELFSKVTEVLVDHFELEQSLIKPEARLLEDLDLDSIDGIELILKLEEQYGEKISAENLKAARTVQDVVNALDNLMLTGDEQNGDSGSTQEK